MKTCSTCNRTFEDQLKFCPDDGSPLRSSARGSDPMVGRVLMNRWEVIERVGSGGFGTVYRVHNRTKNAVEALKVFDPRFMDAQFAADSRIRFDREVSILDRLSKWSSHIVNVSTLEEDAVEGIVYYTMEFVEGETLADVLEREGPLEVNRALEFVIQTCNALIVAHEDHDAVVHRDLKLWNIMVSKDPQGAEFIKVLDFGIAKITGDANVAQLTRGLTQGTPGYASPEQINGEDVDGRTDLFALGVVLFGLLTGKEPWTGGSITDKQANVMLLLKRTAEGNVDPPSIHREELSSEIDALVLKLLEPEPDRRYSSARELRDRLVALQRGATSATTGSLRVSTDDDGARVIVRSGLFKVIAQGATPWVGQGLSPGAYLISLDDPRYARASRRVSVPAGGEVEVSFSTTPRKRGRARLAAAAIAILVASASALALYPSPTLDLALNELLVRVNQGAVTSVELTDAGLEGEVQRTLRRPQRFEAAYGDDGPAAIAARLREAGVRVDVTAVVAPMREALRTAYRENRLWADGANDVAGHAARILEIEPTDEEASQRLEEVGAVLARQAREFAEQGRTDEASALVSRCGQLPIRIRACTELVGPAGR